MFLANFRKIKVLNNNTQNKTSQHAVKTSSLNTTPNHDVSLPYECDAE